MLRIPGQSQRWQQYNGSDKFGNISNSRNINLDRDGYIRLSPRTASLLSSKDEAAFNLPTSFGRRAGGDFEVVTIENPWEITINDIELDYDVDNDTGDDDPPNFDIDSRGLWWENKWHVVDGGNPSILMYKTMSNGNWTDTSVTDLTNGVAHPLESFKSRRTLCIGNGNVVRQYTTAYAASTYLTLPAEFEVIDMAYNNEIMAIVTKLADTTSSVTGIDGDAYFFVWDGSQTSVNRGYAIGTDMILSVEPYKSSFVCITRTGEYLYFNGGGFDRLSTLPIYHTNNTWGDSRNLEAIGDFLKTEGDVTYININNSREPGGGKEESYLANGGVQCFDPAAGLYHRYSPSISPAYRFAVTTDPSSNVFTTSGTIPSTGSQAKYISATTALNGLIVGRVYYVIKLTATTFSLATSYENAIAGTEIDVSGGSPNHIFVGIEHRDFGCTHMSRTGALSIAESPSQSLDHLIFGGEYYDYDSASVYEHVCFTIEGFENIGYIATPKVYSQNIKDSFQTLYIKHRQLSPGESITVKYKTCDIKGAPVSTPQTGAGFTFMSPNILSTTADISEIYEWVNRGNEYHAEFEITSGWGAGEIHDIESIAFDDGTYSVVLKQPVRNAAKTYQCDAVLENWEVAEVQTDTDVDYFEAKIDTKGTWVKYKIIMQGSDVIIEEILVENGTFKPV